MTTTPAEQKSTQQPSVLVDGRVDTSKIVTPETASGRGGRPTMRDTSATPSDPTQDPDWALFEAAHSNSLVPPSQGISEVERFIASQAPQDARIPLPRITGHPAPAKAGPASAAMPGDIVPLPAAQQQAQGAPQAQPAQPTSQPPPASSDDRVRAIAALKRDGWKDSAISKLSDPDILEIGLARASSQAEVDQKFSEFRTRLGSNGSAKAADAPQPPGEKVATPASGGPGQTATPTLDVAAKGAAAQIAKTFTDHWGEEVGGPVGAAFEQSLKSLAQPLVTENAQLRQGLESLAGMFESMVEESVRTAWAATYPQTQDDRTWDEIGKAAQNLMATGRYEASPRGIREAFEHGRRIVLPGVPPAAVQAQRTAEAREYEQSASQQPVVGARAPATAGSSEDGELYSAFIRAHEMSDSAWRAVTGGAQ